MNRMDSWRARAGKLAALGAASSLLMGAVVVTTVGATPVVRTNVIDDTDWTTAGVSGVGSSDTGTITLGGVSGPVTRAFVSWNGIGDSLVGGAYTNANIQVNGVPVAGVSKGESSSNCWGTSVTSRTYVAEITPIVAATGNGAYTLTGLSAGGNNNGAHMVVAFNDGNAANNRDLYLFWGNDTNNGASEGFPGEADGWSDVLDSLNYSGGQAFAHLAVSDGQDFGDPDDGDITFSGPGGTVTHVDTALQANGNSLPDAGSSRAPNGGLYDLHSFDITGAFGALGVTSIMLTAPLLADCLGLTMAAVDLVAAGGPPVSTGSVLAISPASVPEGTPPPKGGASLKFSVTLSPVSAVPVSVTVSTVDGTAIAPGDYASRSQTLTIAPGVHNAAFSVNVRSDAVAEANEFMFATLTAPVNATIGTPTAVGTIIDDDGVVALRSTHTQPNGQGGVG